MTGGGEKSYCGAVGAGGGEVGFFFGVGDGYGEQWQEAGQFGFHYGFLVGW